MNTCATISFSRVTVLHSVNLCREISVTSCLTSWSTVLASKLILSQILEVITSILWFSKVCYHVHNCQTPVPIPSHISSVHGTDHSSCNLHFNIILPHTYNSLVWPFLNVSNQILCTSLIFRKSNTDVTHPSFINLIKLKVTGDKCKVWGPSLANFYQPSDTIFYFQLFSSASYFHEFSEEIQLSE